ncbi:MAG: outer membrane beta-barrel protein [Bacteroidales bacterium]|nr:outer membrane beta-barrel protein [Bacteroidales bacterium]
MIFACSLFSIAKAQETEYMFEIGAGAGISWAYGDINKTKAFYSPAFAGEAIFRYNLNPRWAFAASILSEGVKGDSKDFDNKFPGNAHLKFNNRVWQLSFRPEFNFWNYGWVNDYRAKKHVAPFLTLGAGLGFSTGDGETGFVFSIPIGGGVKWKMTQRTNAQLTCLFSRTFGDKADGIRDPYGIDSSDFLKSDWIGTLLFSVTFDFKERCEDCNKK